MQVEVLNKTKHVDIPSFETVVFAAMSKKYFYMREYIIKHILQQGKTPSCAFMMYSYYLLDTVSRQSLISANNGLIKKSDEIWVYGPISDGVKEELKLSRKLGLPEKYFAIAYPSCEFTEIAERDAEMEVW